MCDLLAKQMYNLVHYNKLIKKKKKASYTIKKKIFYHHALIVETITVVTTVFWDFVYFTVSLILYKSLKNKNAIQLFVLKEDYNLQEKKRCIFFLYAPDLTVQMQRYMVVAKLFVNFYTTLFWRKLLLPW